MRSRGRLGAGAPGQALLRTPSGTAASRRGTVAAFRSGWHFQPRVFANVQHHCVFSPKKRESGNAYSCNAYTFALQTKNQPKKPVVSNPACFNAGQIVTAAGFPDFHPGQLQRTVTRI